jgi:outer membrane phospholipase A
LIRFALVKARVLRHAPATMWNLVPFRRIVCGLGVMLALLGEVAANPNLLLVPPSQAVEAGEALELTVYVNNPSGGPFDVMIPRVLRAEFASGGGLQRLEVRPLGVALGAQLAIAPQSFSTLRFAVTVPATASGTVSLRFTDLPTNPVMFVVTPSAAGAAAAAAGGGTGNDTVQGALLRGESLDLESERETVRRHVSTYEPTYFLLGPVGGWNARLQFSFKYRLVAPSGTEPRWWQSLYFGYTQTSVWDLNGESKPFHDSSYRPTLFFFRDDLRLKPDWMTRLGIQAGLQHESNGQKNLASRSLNTAYFAPAASVPIGDRWRVWITPRFISYVEKEENPDLDRYRGNVEWRIRVGRDQGLQFAATLRKGRSSGYGSGQFDFTVPLRMVPTARRSAAGYLHIQYFNGWGETLIDYNRREDDQYRIGYALTR